jgi:hypothetical protein
MITIIFFYCMKRSQFIIDNGFGMRNYYTSIWTRKRFLAFSDLFLRTKILIKNTLIINIYCEHMYWLSKYFYMNLNKKLNSNFCF